MPRFQRPASTPPLVASVIAGLGVLVLMPLVLLGGLVAVVAGLVTVLVRALRVQRTRRPAAEHAARAPRGVPALHPAEPRAVLAGRHAA